MNAAPRQATQLVASSRIMSFGQNTSQLHARTDGRRKWRAEVPATDAHKEDGAEALAMVRNRLQIRTLQLGSLHDELTARLAEVSYIRM